MIYLIGELLPWLLLVAAFMLLAGWALAAQFAAPGEEASRREREHLVRDLIRFTGDGPIDRDVELDGAPTQRLLQIRDGRIAELERALETARSRTDEVSSALAERERGGTLNDLDAQELARLRAAEIELERTVDVEAEPVEDENAVLHQWRLRYFEQRVKYLETLTQPAEMRALAAPVSMDAQPPVHEWAAREASARATYLEDELRALRAAPDAPETTIEEPEPFAANADVDMLLRWRLLYLERRVAYLQAAAPAAELAVEPAVEAGTDPDRWKWRARYLEARVRHLEQRPMQTVMAPSPDVARRDEPEAAPRVAAPPLSRRAKPPVLPAARNGAPDDLTLIEGVSLLQQTTMYSLGVFHFDQIAAWSEENVAWVDQYLRLQGRIGEEEWLEQARELAAHGPAAARRALESEDA